ncbi:MAG: hypothetical protein EBS29_08015 [Chloroflexia bacterium]|nr:hypothetical protein [Chloroflexia bacterium]
MNCCQVLRCHLCHVDVESGYANITVYVMQLLLLLRVGLRLFDTAKSHSYKKVHWYLQLHS